MISNPSEDKTVDPREVLKGCPVGAMLPMIGRQTYESPIEVVFGIREESQRISFINNNPVAIRMAVLEEKGVFLIPIIIRLIYMGFFTEYFESNQVCAYSSGYNLSKSLKQQYFLRFKSGSLSNGRRTNNNICSSFCLIEVQN